MAKITISQLHTVDSASIQELTNAEIDTTKGGLVPLPAELFGGTLESLQKYLSDGVLKSLGLGV
ncbi:hypothetical protein WA1_20455 [Scytonema hofmannii PCC 7110]|uniref:Uncharacterized protein n=1 Tax=Scytonema hofmannii PCC 7110 TaxID=128403 RepID=A0A139XCB8_9CYAN|nr:hypothetical protein [Scytonema hofmannii]KYC42344.1 hypothetical protein WA1_20455 [Scytonema hofmannii PCC 7110]